MPNTSSEDAGGVRSIRPALSIATLTRPHPSRAQPRPNLPGALSLLPDGARALASAERPQIFAAGSVLVDPSSPSKDVVFVLEGSLDVRRCGSTAEGSQLVARLSAGDLFGWQPGHGKALSGNRVVATSTVRVVCCDRSRVQGCLVSSSEHRLLDALAFPAVRRLVSRAQAAGATSQELRDMLERVRLSFVASGELVLRRDQVPRELLLVLSGEVEFGSRWLSAGDLVGTEAQLLGVPCRHAATAAGPGALIGVIEAAALPANVRRSVAAEVADRACGVGLRTWCEATDWGDLYAAEPVAPRTEDEIDVEAFSGKSPAPFRQPPTTLQRSTNDCAIACLCMLLEYHGVDADFESVRSTARISRYGTTLDELEQSAKRLGFRTASLAVDFEGLLALDLPVIAHLPTRNHYVLVFRASARGVLLADPAVGRLQMTRSQFSEAWQGIVLAATPNLGFRERATELVGARSSPFSAMLRKHKSTVASVLLAAVLIEVLALVTPMLTQVVIDQAIPAENRGLLETMSVCLAVVAVFVALFQMAKSYLTSHVAARLEGELLDQLYARLVSAHDGLLSRYTGADILGRFADVTAVKNFLTDTVLHVASDGLILLPALGLAFLYDAALAALFVGSLLTLSLVSWLIARRVHALARRFRTRYDRFRQQLVDTINGHETVTFQGLQAEFVRWMRSLLGPMVGSSRELNWFSECGQIVTQLLGAVFATFIFCVGVQHVMHGALTLGQFMAFNMLSAQASAPLMRLMQEWSAWQRTSVSLARVGELLPEQPARPALRVNLQPGRLRGAIRFSDVHYRYERDPKDRQAPAIEKMTFDIPPGQIVGIVGRSGSGKSTLVKLLLGHLKPQRGMVTVDGVRLDDLQPEEFMRCVGYVSQDSHLFSSSVTHNITCGRAVSMDQVARAAKCSGADEFIRDLPYGFGTILGEEGVKLSGGQKQKVMLARALVEDPAMVVLDEATAALDALSEQEIFSRLSTFSAGRTTFVITHRLATLRHVDRVLVLDGGRVCEDGTPDELLRQGGLFHELSRAAPQWEMP